MRTAHSPPWRLPVVGVLGSAEEAWEDRAARVGRWLATQDVHLLTGGGLGVMESVSRAFHAVPGRKGLVLGILPRHDMIPNRPRPSYPNRWVEIPVYTHLRLSGARGTEPMSRNHINVLSSDVLIALPGGLGTASEVELALQYERPVIAYVRDRSEISALPEATLIESDFARVQAFVRARIQLAD